MGEGSREHLTYNCRGRRDKVDSMDAVSSFRQSPPVPSISLGSLSKVDGFKLVGYTKSGLDRASRERKRAVSEQRVCKAGLS